MSKRLWQGAFEGASDAVTAFNSSENAQLDSSLIFYDIVGSIAHVKMLKEQKILSESEAISIISGLKSVLEQSNSGKFTIDPKLEDVHSNVENAVTKITANGKKMHTARSRNDQVLVDMRLYTRDQSLVISKAVLSLQKALVLLAKNDGVMVGYTHTRVAQPITISFWAESYISGLNRDLERLLDCFKRINRNPLGACALAGTSWPIDRQITADLLGFDSVEKNELDAVSSRGELEAELASVLSLLMTRLSGISEELIWLSQKGLVKIPDSFCTGSSIMPNKKNPDVLELIRGRTARVQSNLFHIIGVKKGLAAGYHSDMQETKYAIMSAIKNTNECVSILALLIPQLTFDQESISEELEKGYSQATEIADSLARSGVPFRDAHGLVGKLVFECAEKGISLSQAKPLSQFSAAQWKEITSLKRKRLEVSPKVNSALEKQVDSLSAAIQKKYSSLV